MVVMEVEAHDMVVRMGDSVVIIIVMMVGTADDDACII